MKAFTIDVNPKNLVWAREEAGFSINDMLEHTKMDEATFRQWELDGKAVRFSTLTKLAAKYKRQVAVFFLPHTPEKVKKPKDYRNLSLSHKGLHSDTMLAIRRTSRYLQTYRELSGLDTLATQYDWLTQIRNSLKSSDVCIREILDVSIDEQKKAKNHSFKFWRTRIEEKLSIFVFQFPIHDHEFDGFSYVEDGYPYAITVNSDITENRKIFTLFHEIGHIIEGSSGLCFTDSYSAYSGDEARCNSFAADFLMPKDEMVAPGDFDELGRLARTLGVSREAYLIRCKTLNLVSDKDVRLYKSLINQYNAELKKKDKKKKDGFAIPPATLSRSRRGDKFFDFVVDNYRKQKIGSSTVRDLLDMKVVGLGRSQK